MIWAVGGIALGLAILAIWDIHKNADSLQYVYISAPTYGNIRVPPITQIGPPAFDRYSRITGANSSYYGIPVWSTN